MEEENLLKKISNFFLHVFLAIISFLKKLFGKDKKASKKDIWQDIKKIEQPKREKIVNTNPTTLPDTKNTNNNDHINNDDNANNDNDIILKLNNDDLKRIKFKDTHYIILSDEELDELIDECLEEEYKEEKLKVKETSKEFKETIKEFKEKVVEVIKENIVKKLIATKEDLKEEIKVVIKEEVKEKPLMPKVKDLKIEKQTEDRKEIYFLATPIKKEINVKEEKVVLPKPKVLATVQDKQTIKKKLEEKPYFMVKNVNEVPKENLKEDLKNAVIVGGMLSAKAVLDLVTPLPTEENEKETLKEKEEVKEEKRHLVLDEKQTPKISEENILEEAVVLPKLKELETQLEEIEKKETFTLDNEEIIEETKEEVKERNEVIEEKILEQKVPSLKMQEEIIKKNKEDLNLENIPQQIPQEEEKKNEVKPKEIVSLQKIDDEILSITLATAFLISSTKNETEKKELEDKDYDSKEEQITKMLDDIEVTLIKYEGKMNEKQKMKLKQEQENLRNVRINLDIKKQEDITREAKALDETIKDIELSGLQNELQKLHIENQIEANEILLSKIDGLESLTKEQIANIDKKMLMKRLNKISILTEMTSILALPFIRNKYFFYFTIGLIIDNHFNFINAFFKRKINRYKPADLEQIKRGEDALNSALNMTYKNQVQLEYIVSESLAKYPELADNPEFINKINVIRMQLEHNYQKMMKKKKIMEKYHRKTKSQIKVLKRDEEINAA